MLCARYKLDGNVENIGDVDTVDTWVDEPVFETGCIYEKSMSSGSMKWDAESTAKILNNNAFTWAAWVYVNPNVSIQTQPFFGNGSFGANNNRKFFINQSPTKNDITWSWMNDTGAITFIEGTLSDVLPDYEWTHVAVTFGEETFKIYINGICEFTQNGVKSESSSFKYITNVFYSNPARRLQDVRIYNEAISAEEIKELSYGLEEHEKLNATPLIIGRSNFTTTSSDFYVHTGHYYNGLVKGKNYVFKVVCDSPHNSLKDSHGNADGNLLNRTWTAWLYTQDSVYNESNYSGYIDPINFNICNYNHKQVGNAHYWIWKATRKNVSIRLNGYKSSQDYSLNFPEFKLYSEEDTKLQIDDTPRYNKAAIINKSLSLMPYVVDKSNSLAISFWVKFNALEDVEFFRCAIANAYTKVHQINYADDGTVLSEHDFIEKSSDGVSYKSGSLITDNGNTELIYTPYAKQGITLRMKDGLVTLGIDDSSVDVKNISDDNWHHFVINSSGKRVVDVYLDGEKVATGEPKANVKVDRASSTERLSFNGDICVSDFRLYGKHLTDEMALRLYGISPDDYDLTK